MLKIIIYQICNILIVKNKIMITKFKLFESTYDDIDYYTVIECGYYIESQLPKTDYFDWEYEWWYK